MLSHIQKYDILLASNSPRRRELLSGLGIEYQVTALPNIDESYAETLQGEEIPQYIATVKAEAYKPEMSDKTLLITADTIVWLNGKVFGKPKDKDDAKNMLRTLSGNIHTVITGVCITTQEKQISFSYFDLMSIPVITTSVQRDLRAGAHHRHVVPFCVTGNSLLRQKRIPHDLSYGILE